MKTGPVWLRPPDFATVLEWWVACVYEAVRANLTCTLPKVSTFFEGEPGRLGDLLLRRWDRHNLLAIVSLEGDAYDCAVFSRWLRRQFDSV